MARDPHQLIRLWKLTTQAKEVYLVVSYELPEAMNKLTKRLEARDEQLLGSRGLPGMFWRRIVAAEELPCKGFIDLGEAFTPLYSPED